MNKCKIAKRLTNLRNVKGITQAELASALSVSDKVISKWENGISEPSLDMLISIAEYYEVSTDALLGIKSNENNSILEILQPMFKDAGVMEKFITAFEVSRNVILALCKGLKGEFDMNAMLADKNSFSYPETVMEYPRYRIALQKIYGFSTSTEDTNLSVMLLQNKNNFSWLKDKQCQEKICTIFEFLKEPDALSVCYFIHSTACSYHFTADYIALNTEVPETKVKVLLDDMVKLDLCEKSTAHLVTQNIDVYESSGDGMLLTILTLAYEFFFGERKNYHAYNGICKMISGGGKNESIG